MFVKRVKVSHFLYSNGVIVSIAPGTGKYTELFFHLIKVIFHFLFISYLRNLSKFKLKSIKAKVMD